MKAPDKLLAKKFLGTLTNPEKDELQQWLAESEGNQQILDQAQEIWTELGFETGHFTEDRKVAWEMMVKSLKPSSVSEKRSLSKLIGQTVLIIILLFVVMGIGITLLTGTVNTTITGKQRSQRVSLPDGTIAYLDSGTTIKYSKLFGSRNRTVNLKGEAIFEAMNAHKLSLTIRTKQGKVILNNGIADVKTDGEIVLEAIALRGDIQMKTFNKASIVKESNMVSLDSLGNLTVLPADLNLIAWRTGQLVANNTPLGKLIRPIEKYTRKKVVFNSAVSYSQLLTFTIKPLSERAIADTLARNLNLKVMIDDQKVVFY